MSYRQFAKLLRSTASALEHGRFRTATYNLKLITLHANAELIDLLESDIYTDAPEYRMRVNRIYELLREFRTEAE
jgi:hypothetical protein